MIFLNFRPLPSFKCHPRTWRYNHHKIQINHHLLVVAMIMMNMNGVLYWPHFKCTRLRMVIWRYQVDSSCLGWPLGQVSLVSTMIVLYVALFDCMYGRGLQRYLMMSICKTLYNASLLQHCDQIFILIMFALLSYTYTTMLFRTCMENETWSTRSRHPFNG